MRLIKVSLILIILISVIACSKTPGTKGKTDNTMKPEDRAANQAIFAKYCADCHGAKGEGQPSVKVPGLNDQLIATKSDEQLIENITNGKGNMPAFRSILTPEQISNLVQFIRQDSK
jgi:mono/diheme cytochrome c family protein